MVLKKLCRRHRISCFLNLGILICFLLFVKLMITLPHSGDFIRKVISKAEMNHNSFRQRKHDSVIHSDLPKNGNVKRIKKTDPDIGSNLINDTRALQNNIYKPQDEHRKGDEVIVTSDQYNQTSIEEAYNINPREEQDEESDMLTESPNESHQTNADHHESNISDKNTQALNINSIVVDGIYWSNQVENLIPKGISNNDIKGHKKSLNESHVEVLEPASLQTCGRPKNAYVIMSDGTQACARYRYPDDKYLTGDVLSFYLSRLIQLDNVPTVVLTRLTNSSTQWRGTPYKTLEWEEGKIIALIQWMNDCRVPVKVPKLLLMALEKNLTVDAKMIAVAAKSEKQVSKFLLEMAQLGTMIIFDYLTATHDRVAFMQFHSERSNRPSLMQDNIRNLCKTDAGKLWLIDNECGLLEAYGFVYGSRSGANYVFGPYHRSMLQTMCIFQKPIVTALKELHINTSPHTVLELYANTHEKLLDEVPKNERLYRLFVLHFHERLQEVIDWIHFCETKK